MMPRMQEEVTQNVGLVGYLHNLVCEHPDFETLYEPTLCYGFRYMPNVLAERQAEPEVQELLDRLNEEIVTTAQRGGITVSMTHVGGRIAIRIPICSQRMLKEDVDATFEAIARCGRLLTKKELSVRCELTRDMESKLC